MWRRFTVVPLIAISLNLIPLMTLNNIVDHLLAKTTFLLTATLASAWTSVVNEAHAIVAFIAALLSTVFAALNIYTWFEARRRVNMEPVPQAIAISTGKLEKDEEEKKQ